MNETVSKITCKAESLLSLAGPIFEKELRVASRHKRNYFLRFAYILVLTAFIAGTWFMATSAAGASSRLFQVAQMSETGRRITVTLVWFQFIGIQIVSMVLLSTAVSDELYNRTLGILMTTPISARQIVLGKLSSKLLHVSLLLAIGLPLLAVARVLGGVPTGFLMVSFCITLSAAIFAGCVSFFFSMHRRQSHVVVTDAAVVCLIVYGGPSLLIYLLSSAYAIPTGIGVFAAHSNPAGFLAVATRQMLNPSAAGPAIPWPVPCLMTLIGAGCVLILTIRSLRRLALKQALGEPGLLGRNREARRARQERPISPRPTSTIRRIKGPAIIWKEMRSSYARSSRLRKIFAIWAVVALLTAAYGTCFYFGLMDHKVPQSVFVFVYVLAGLLRTATVSATAITSEKEAGSWPVLLTTPLHQTRIAAEKVVGAFMKSWPIWLLLIVHILVFAAARCIHPIALILIPAVTFAAGILVSAIGILCSSWFCRSSLAGSLQLICFLIFAVPLCWPLPTYLLSPLLIVGVILSGTAGGELAGRRLSQLQYAGVWYNDFAGVLAPALVLLAVVTVYLLMALVCLALSSANIRSRVFPARKR